MESAKGCLGDVLCICKYDGWIYHFWRYRKAAIEAVGVVDPERIVKELCDQANNKEKVSHNIIEDKK